MNIDLMFYSDGHCLHFVGKKLSAYLCKTYRYYDACYVVAMVFRVVTHWSEPTHKML